MHGVINKSALFTLSSTNYFQAWHRKSSSWWVLDVQRADCCARDFQAAASSLSLSLKWASGIPRNIRHSLLGTLGRGETQPPAHLGAGGLPPSHCRCKRKAVLRSPPRRCPRPDITAMPWVSPGAHQMEGQQSQQVPFSASQRCATLVPSRQRGANRQQALAGWEEEHFGPDTRCGCCDTAGSCSWKALVKTVTEAFSFTPMEFCPHPCVGWTRGKNLDSSTHKYWNFSSLPTALSVLS